MSQPFLLRKETPWHDSIINSWPTHPTRRTLSHIHFCINLHASTYHVDGHTNTYSIKQHKTLSQLTWCMCRYTPTVCSRQYFMMDTVTVCLPWCKNVTLRSLTLSWIQINADMNRVELSDTELSLALVLIGLFADLVCFSHKRLLFLAQCIYL